MSVRSASRGSPAAKSIRLALRTSSIVATRRASFVRWVLRCFGRRRLSSSPKLPAISVMPSMMRFQVPPRADPLNHTPIRHVNNLLLKLIYGKQHPPNVLEDFGAFGVERHYFVDNIGRVAVGNLVAAVRVLYRHIKGHGIEIAGLHD